MNETEFLDLLRYYFRNAKTEEVEEILADYESHFEEGKKRGLSEEEIARELGSPKDIYNSFQSEGVVDEKAKGSPLKSRALDMAKDAQDKMGKTWDAVSPRLPGAAEATARMTARLLTAAGIIMAIVVLAAGHRPLLHQSGSLPRHDPAAPVQFPYPGLHRKLRYLYSPFHLPYRQGREPGHRSEPDRHRP